MSSSSKTDPAATARQAAAAIQELNHQTLDIDSMSAPEIHSTVRALADLVDRLPQACEQLAHLLERELAADRVCMEDGRDPAAPVGQAAAGLRQVAALASPAHRVNYGDPAGEFAAAVHDAAEWLYNMAGVSTGSHAEEDNQ
ncbi:hypothetical protein [Kitasatospora sp. NPDC059160]|uniref:hypothetical protein n=1 Tax=Kitasatospora sp. NPDC059160 TaxID=3346748 RepID=UPI0036952FDF